eukprot:SAG11_NODE_6027_length_1406_cov_1.893650_1_plen_76_part_01
MEAHLPQPPDPVEPLKKRCCLCRCCPTKKEKVAPAPETEGESEPDVVQTESEPKVQGGANEELQPEYREELQPVCP